jgi:hypothetical protein
MSGLSPDGLAQAALHPARSMKYLSIGKLPSKAGITIADSGCGHCRP